MEQNGLMLSGIGNSPLAKIIEAKQGLKIFDCSDDKIKETIKYVFALLGIPANKMPNDLEKIVLLEFIRQNYSEDIRLEEIKLAFSLAVSGGFEIDLNLYGEPFSAKYLANVMTAYKQFRLSENRKAVLKSLDKKKNEEGQLNNIQRLSLIIPHLKDETIRKVEELVKQKEKPSERKKLPFHDLHQKWFSQFDKLYLKYEAFDNEGKALGSRHIKRYGGDPINQERYFAKKMDQLFMAKIRSEYNSTHRIEKVAMKYLGKLKPKQMLINGDYSTYKILLTAR